MPDIQRQEFEAITLAQWRALNLTRPLTDAAIGGMSEAKRTIDARCSALFAEPGIAQPGWRKPEPRRHTNGGYLLKENL